MTGNFWSQWSPNCLLHFISCSAVMSYNYLPSLIFRDENLLSLGNNSLFYVNQDSVCECRKL